LFHEINYNLEIWIIILSFCNTKKMWIISNIYFCLLNVNPLIKFGCHNFIIWLVEKYLVWKNMSKMIIHIYVTKKDHFDSIINTHRYSFSQYIYSVSLSITTYRFMHFKYTVLYLTWLALSRIYNNFLKILRNNFTRALNPEIYSLLFLNIDVIL